MPRGPFADLRDAIAAADGLLFATPEYNSSIPGVLKNAIDWASRPARPRRSRASRRQSSAPPPAASAPSGRRPSCARCSRSTGARVIELDLPVAKAHEIFDDDHPATITDHDERIDEILEALAAEIATELEFASAA